jgi:hypothetical protein
MPRKKKQGNVKPAEIKEMLKLRLDGKKLESIVETTGRDIRTVKKHLLLSDELKYRFDKHCDYLLSLVPSLTSCLVDPQLQLLKLESRKPMNINGYDWRLDPKTWLTLCTPDLSDESVIDSEIIKLLQHLRSGQYFEHFKALSDAAASLQNEYETAAVKYAKFDDNFGKSWEALKNNAWKLGVSKIPGTTGLNRESYKPYYGEQYSQNVMKAFYPYITDLSVKQWDLEKKLQELWTDLSPDIVIKTIRLGRCKECKKMWESLKP